MKSTTARGYGAPHQRERRRWAQLLQQRGALPCARNCGHDIHPGDDWHLDHSNDRTRYLGPSHVRCNTSAGGRKGNARWRARRNATPTSVTRLRW